MVRHSAMVILLLALLGLVYADQICIQTKSKVSGSLRTTTYGGTNCPLRVKAYIKNSGWKYAFIDKYSTSNWRSTEYGQAYVSKQRVHEHTDSCFEMQSGFNSVDLDKDIYVKFTDSNCNDAMYVDRFFIPQRKAWGISNTQGWCMNGKRHLENNYEFDNAAGLISTFNDGCAREWKLKPNGFVSAKRWGSSSGFGTRGTGRRALREVEPVQDFRFMGLPESERREISLIEALYDVCENFDLGEDFDSSDRYERETEQIVRRCYDMLSRFQGTYQEFEAKEERAILLTEHRSLTEEMERVLEERFPKREKKERSTEDLETSESDSVESGSLDRLMSKIRSLP